MLKLFFRSFIILGAGVGVLWAANNLFNKPNYSTLLQEISQTRKESFLLTASKTVSRTSTASKSQFFLDNEIPGLTSTLEIQAAYLLSAGINPQEIRYDLRNDPSGFANSDSQPTLVISLPHPAFRPVAIGGIQLKTDQGFMSLGADLKPEINNLLNLEKEKVQKDFCLELSEQAIDQAASIEQDRIQAIAASLQNNSPFQVEIQKPKEFSCP